MGVANGDFDMPYFLRSINADLWRDVVASYMGEMLSDRWLINASKGLVDNFEVIRVMSDRKKRLVHA